MARPRTCSVKYFCLGAFLIFLGSVLLCALGFTIVLPHKETLSWPKVSCHVTNASYDKNHCSCDQQIMEYTNCVDKHPCLKIAIAYNISGDIFSLLDDDSTNLTALWNLLAEYSGTDVGINNNNGPFTGESNNGYKHHSADRGKTSDNKGGSTNNMRYHGNSNDVTNTYNGGAIRTTTLTNWNTKGYDNGSHSNEKHHGVRNDVYYGRRESHNGKKGLVNNPMSLVVHGMLYRRWSDSFHKTCALYECGDELWNVKEVRRFQMEWGQRGQSFPCFFDPEYPHVAVIERTPKSQAVHALFWPALSLFTGSLIWMGMCLGCWKIETEQPQNSSTYYRGIL